MTDQRTRFETLATGVGIGFAGYLAIVAWAVVLLAIAQSLTGPIDAVERHAINTAALALGTVLVIRVYLTRSGRGTAYLDLGWPTPRELGAAVATVPVLFGVAVLAGALGVTPAEHGLEDAVRGGGVAVAVPIAVSSILVVGPAEELLYRNLVQKILTDRFHTVTAILVASLVFAVVHTTAYWTGSPIEVASALGLVFVLSVLLGTLYAVTDRVVVPALAHGGYDAVVFLLIALDPFAV